MGCVRACVRICACMRVRVCVCVYVYKFMTLVEEMLDLCFLL